MRIYVESREAQETPSLSAVKRIVEGTRCVTRIESKSVAEVVLVHLTNPYDIENYMPYTPCIYYRKGWVLVYKLPDESIISTEPVGHDYMTVNSCIYHFLLELKEVKEKHPMENTIYLAKSNKANPNIVSEIRYWLTDCLSYKLEEYEGGYYSDAPLAYSKLAIIVTDGFKIGKGIYEQINVCVKTNKPFLLVIPTNECYYFAARNNFDIRVINPLDYINYANIDLTRGYNKRPHLELNRIEGFIKSNEPQAFIGHKEKKKYKPDTPVTNNRGEVVTPSEAVKSIERQNIHLLLMRRFLK